MARDICHGVNDEHAEWGWSFYRRTQDVADLEGLSERLLATARAYWRTIVVALRLAIPFPRATALPIRSKPKGSQEVRQQDGKGRVQAATSAGAPQEAPVVCRLCGHSKLKHIRMMDSNSNAIACSVEKCPCQLTQITVQL